MLELGQSLFASIDEVDFATRALPAVEAALVHEMMVVPAQQYEIIEARLAALRPVTDVMAVDESALATG